MRLATIEIENSARPALVLNEEALDLVAARSFSSAARLVPDAVMDILAAGTEGRRLLNAVCEDLRNNASAARSSGALRPLNAVKLCAPIPLPRMILAVGANYHEHLKEMNAQPPATPMAFYKSVASVIGDGDDIVLPPSNPDMVDWEGEFAVVIGTACHNVSEADALDYVAGYTILNDVSARDWVTEAFEAKGMMPTIVSWEHNILGKLFPTFCPIGPFIVTSDEISNPESLSIETRLNGRVVQSSNTSDLVFNVRQIIAYYSKFLTFMPGDIISTGSPSGVGFGHKPPLFMREGDVIEVTVESIGTLRNTIARKA